MFKPPPRSIKARDRRVIVRCPICKSATVRNSRNQVYCSARCRKSAFLHRKSDRDVCVAVKPSNGFAGTDPFKNETNSKPYGGGFSTISGPPSVINSEIINAHKWTEVVSVHGVRSFVAILRPPSLRYGCAP
jgi:hypothetical protein